MVILPRSAQLDLVMSVRPVQVNQMDLRVDFWVRNKGNLAVSPSAFEFLNSDPCRPSYGLFTLNSQMGERSAIEVVQQRSADLMQQRSADLMQQRSADLMQQRSVEVSRPHAAEVSIPHAVEVSRPHAAEVSKPHPVEVSRPCPVELISSCRAQLVQFRSARQDLTTYDLQLRKVISPSSELRFGCSGTLWKAHRVKNSFKCLRRILGVRPRCQNELTEVRSARPVQVSSSRLTTYDLQLRKVITSPSELRFGCSWTLWKSH